jgi:hypothetical protein
MKFDFWGSISRWVVRSEFTMRLSTLPRFILQIVLQILTLVGVYKVKGPMIWIYGTLSVLLIIIGSWYLDKTPLRRRIEGEGGKRSDPWIEINEKIDKLLKDRGLM